MCNKMTPHISIFDIVKHISAETFFMALRLFLTGVSVSFCLCGLQLWYNYVVYSPVHMWIKVLWSRTSREILVETLTLLLVSLEFKLTPFHEIFFKRHCTTQHNNATKNIWRCRSQWSAYKLCQSVPVYYCKNSGSLQSSCTTGVRHIFWLAMPNLFWRIVML